MTQKAPDRRLVVYNQNPHGSFCLKIMPTPLGRSPCLVWHRKATAKAAPLLVQPIAGHDRASHGLDKAVTDRQTQTGAGGAADPRRVHP